MGLYDLVGHQDLSMKRPEKIIVQELWLKILVQQKYQKKKRQNGLKPVGEKKDFKVEAVEAIAIMGNKIRERVKSLM